MGLRLASHLFSYPYVPGTAGPPGIGTRYSEKEKTRLVQVLVQQHTHDQLQGGTTLPNSGQNNYRYQVVRGTTRYVGRLRLSAESCITSPYDIHRTKQPTQPRRMKKMNEINHSSRKNIEILLLLLLLLLLVQSSTSTCTW